MLMRPAPLVTLAPLVALATMLTGCWTGSGALMPASARDSAPIAGEYVLVENVDPRGLSKIVNTPALLRARPLGTLVRIEPLGPDAVEGKSRTVSFDELQPGLFLAQSTFDEKGSRIDYYIVGVEDGGASVIVLVPPCGVAERQLGGRSDEADPQVCSWSSYDALRKAAEELVTRDPETAGIRQVMEYKRQ